MTLTTERLKWLHDAATELSATKLKMTMRPDELLVLTTELLANREAQPVAYTEQCEINNMQATGLYLRGFPNNSQGRNIPLYTAPPAPAVVNGRTAEAWMAEALLQKKIADDLRKSAPAVPEAIITAPIDAMRCGPAASYVLGWNACRAAMLAAAPEGGNDHDTRR